MTGAMVPARFVLVVFALLASWLAATTAHAKEPVVVWHSYRGGEERGLREAVVAAEAALGIKSELLAVPFDAYLAKLQAAVPSGNGPDLFIDAHERLGVHARLGVVAPLPNDSPRSGLPARLEETLLIDGRRYGVALATKALALYVNEALLPRAPATLQELEATPLPSGVYPLAYEAENVFFHAAFVHAFGGLLLSEDGLRYGGSSAFSQDALALVRTLTERGVVPREPNGALVLSLFTTGRAAAVIGGPYLAAELGAGGAAKVRYRVAKLPFADAAQRRPLRSYVTVEAAMFTPRGAASKDALALGAFLSQKPASVIRARVGQQVVTDDDALAEPDLAADETLRVFRQAALDGIPLSAAPAMRAVWQPTGQAIKKVLRGDATEKAALVEAERRFNDALRPPPPAAAKMPWLVALGVLLAAVCAFMVSRAGAFIRSGEARRSARLVPWTLTAAVSVVVLVVVPLAVGAFTSFFAGTRQAPTFVGFANYVDILTARGGPLFGADSVYRTLVVTVLWTAVNLALHVALGLFLGTLLARPTLRLRGLYRVLLIVPWAVPSYVTALVWKGMFHRQFGAVNALLALVGVSPVSWFSRFGTAFTANVITNAWLGFPFMMVVVSGALSSMDPTLLEAAEVDGATRWQRFRLVTMPIVLPAIAPAVALGGVWTFNMFNVVYLVSGGEPDGATDILVSEAYRWAFTREAQLGYGTAYAVLIFLLLLLFTRTLRARQG